MRVSARECWYCSGCALGVIGGLVDRDIACVGCQLVLSLSLESGFDIRSSGVLRVCFRLRRLGRYSVGSLGGSFSDDTSGSYSVL